MFGLMKHRPISRNLDQSYNYRQFYCGTCKTMGKSFGQTSRMLLNHDAIFLGELLHDIAQGETPLIDHSSAYDSLNCFNLPDREEIPNSLQYAAAANVLLGSLSADDHTLDAQGKVKQLSWHVAKKMLEPALNKAKPILEKSQLPMQQIYNWIDEQQLRESNAKSFNSYQEAAQYYAEPTARITGLIFQHGAISVDQEQQGEVFFEFGLQFGRLIYLLDAFEDFIKDQKREVFNGLNAAYLACDQQLKDVTITIPYLQQQLQFTKEQLERLPISDELKAIGVQRMLTNANRLLGVEQACCDLTTADCTSKMSFKEKWTVALAFSKNVLSKGHNLQKTWWTRLHQRTSEYALATTMMMAPDAEIREVSQQQEMAISTYSQLTTLPVIGGALLGLLLVTPMLSRTMPKNPKQAVRKTADCWGDCFEECVIGCITLLCEACCYVICESIKNPGAKEERRRRREERREQRRVQRTMRIAEKKNR